MLSTERQKPRDTGSPEQKEADPGNAPLSESIPNANAAGDGALGRSMDSLLQPEDEERKSRSDEGIQKDPEPY